MKKYLRILALLLVFVMGGIMLVSCAKTLSGTYEAELDLALKKYTESYTFKGTKVTMIRKSVGGITGSVDATEYNGTYEIAELADGSMTISMTLTNVEDESDVIEKNDLAFEQGDDYIIIGTVKYTQK